MAACTRCPMAHGDCQQAFGASQPSLDGERRKQLVVLRQMFSIPAL